MVPSICDLCGLSFQLSFDVIKAPFEPRNSRNGSVSTVAAGTFELASEGPRPRTTTGLLAFPVMMNPPINTLSPISTRRRVEILRAWAGVGVGVGLGVGVGVGVGVGPGVTV